MVPMAAFKVGSATILLVLALLSTQPTVWARTLSGSKSDLAARLRLNDQEPPSCWESLFQLQSCTGEVIMFFVNGETYLGPKCCEAIRAVEHGCWPDLLHNLGYTTEESDVLEEYCQGIALDPQPLPLSPEANKENPVDRSSP